MNVMISELDAKAVLVLETEWDIEERLLMTSIIEAFCSGLGLCRKTATCRDGAGLN